MVASAKGSRLKVKLEKEMQREVRQALNEHVSDGKESQDNGVDSEGRTIRSKCHCDGGREGRKLLTKSFQILNIRRHIKVIRSPSNNN